jgi:ANTAR domain
VRCASTTPCTSRTWLPARGGPGSPAPHPTAVWRSLLSFQLFVRRENLGALNLFADESAAFNEESLLIGGTLARHASIAMIGAAAQTQFDAALASRDIVGQAKGLLMHRENLTGIQAFALLLKPRRTPTSNSSTSPGGS